MTLALSFAQSLLRLGCTRVYGLPGEDHMSLLHALSEAGVEYHASTDESAAVMMAAADARVSGSIGVVLLSLAPGLSNAMNGLLSAFMDGVPLLVISGQHAARDLPFTVRQGFNLGDLVRPVVKWSVRIAKDSDVDRTLAKAVDVANDFSPWPGPVYVEFPDDVAAASVDILPNSSDVRSQRHGAKHAHAATTRYWDTPPTLDAIASGLARSRRPVIIVGGRERALRQDLLARLSARFRAPLFLTVSQLGIADGDSGWFAGTFLNGNLEAELLSRADFVLAFELQSHDIYNRGWTFDAPLVSVSRAAITEDQLPFQERHVVPSEQVVQHLVSDRIEDVLPLSDWTLDDVEAYRIFVRQRLLESGGGSSLTVGSATDQVLSVFQRDAIVVADAGFSKPVVSMLSRISDGCQFLSSNGLSTMGFALPSAIGARRASERPIVAFTGDGSLLMRCGELIRAAELRTPIVVVAFIDGALAQIAIKQGRRNLRAVGVALPKLSCEAIGAAFGVTGYDVSTQSELALALTSARESKRSSLIGVHVDIEDSTRLFKVLRG